MLLKIVKDCSNLSKVIEKSLKLVQTCLNLSKLVHCVIVGCLPVVGFFTYKFKEIKVQFTVWTVNVVKDCLNLSKVVEKGLELVQTCLSLSSASSLAVFPSWFFSHTSTRRSRYSVDSQCCHRLF